jgi:hypothetical protein
MNPKIVRAGRVVGICVLALLVLPVRAQPQPPSRPQPRQEAQRPEGGRAEPTPRPGPRAEMPPVEEARPEPPPQTSGGGGRQEGRGPQRPEPPTTVRLEATVFRVELPSERIIELDSKKLAADGATPAKMAKLLQGYGPTRVLYRVDQVPATGGQREASSLSLDVPYVANRQTNQDGGESASIARTKLGMRLEVHANYPDEGERSKVYATVRVEVTGMSETSIEVSEDVPAPAFWSVYQSYAGLTELGRPSVLLTADSASSDDHDNGAAIVTLLVLSDEAKK